MAGVQTALPPGQPASQRHRLDWAGAAGGSLHAPIDDVSRRRRVLNLGPGHELHRLGRAKEAQINFDSLAEIGITENNFVQQAGIQAQLGQTEQAINSLNVAYSYRDPGLTQLMVDPFSDPLRDDPRFIELLERVGLKR